MLKLKMEQLAGMNCHYVRHSLDYFLDSMCKLGIKNIELYDAGQHYFAEFFTAAMVKDLRKKIEDRGLKLICVTPDQVLYPYNIAASEDYLRKISIEHHVRTLYHTALLDCKLMLLTPGFGNLNESREEAWKRSAEAIHFLAERADSLGVSIGLEHLTPISSNLINTAADIRRMLDTVAHPAVKALVDVVQVCTVGETLDEYFRILGKDLVHIHLVDGTPGGHLAFGDGELPMKEFMRTISRNNYTGFLSMEIAHRQYFMEPEKADEKSIALFQKWINELDE
jgi:protein FrlC